MMKACPVRMLGRTVSLLSNTTSKVSANANGFVSWSKIKHEKLSNILYFVSLEFGSNEKGAVGAVGILSRMAIHPVP